MNIKELFKMAPAINQANKDKGFWPESGRPDYEIRALINSEIGEAIECVRKAKCAKDTPTSTFSDSLKAKDPVFIEVFKQDYKETVECEIADIVIRCLDAIGQPKYKEDWNCLCKFSRTNTHYKDYGYNTTIEVLDVAAEILYMVFANENPLFVRCCWLVDFIFNAEVKRPDGIYLPICDLGAWVRAKLAYNNTRPHKHGKKF